MSLSDINPQIDPGSSNTAADVGSTAPTTNGNTTATSIKDTAVNSKVLRYTDLASVEILADLRSFSPFLHAPRRV